MKMRTLQCNIVQYLPKWDTSVGDYATHRGLSMIKTEILVSIATEPHIFHQLTVAYWRHMATQMWFNTRGSTLAQVMAWCLTAPSHSLNQCSFLSEVLWHSSESNSTARAQAIILHNELESYILKITFISHWGHCVITVYTENKTSSLHAWKTQYHVRVHHNIFLSMACNALASIKWNRHIGSAATLDLVFTWSYPVVFKNHTRNVYKKCTNVCWHHSRSC